MKNLFDEEVITIKKKGNPYHGIGGRFSNKDEDRTMRAEKRALIAENRVKYLESLYGGCGAMLRQQTERANKLESELKQLKNK